MRRAFVGLSGPLAYCYKRADDQWGIPHPILEDSMGLLVLYDEIVFLSRELCPENMRDLPYVRFLSESAADFYTRMPKIVRSAEEVYEKEFVPRGRRESPFERWNPAVELVTNEPLREPIENPKFRPDNHGRRFAAGEGLSLYGASASLKNVLIDWAIRDAFELDDCEVVSNSGNSAFYESLRPHRTPDTKLAIGHAIVVRGLPNYLGPYGPYHPCLEELRHHAFVEEAREHLDQIAALETAREAAKVADEIVRTANEVRRSVFQKYLQKESEYKSVVVAGLTEGIGSMIPGVGFLKDMISARAAEREKAVLRWAGFVADTAEGDWTKSRIV